MSGVAVGADPDDRQRRDDAWLDEALAESFPASDPLPLFHGEDPTGPESAEERPPRT